MKNSGNIYIPSEVTIQDVKSLTDDVKLYALKVGKGNPCAPGQFFMVSVYGAGEVPISVASGHGEPLMLCIRKVGSVTSAIHELKAGESIGLRGPYGRGFPLDLAKGRDMVVMAGGIGIVPLRALIVEIIKERSEYGKVFLLYGTKSPAEILFREEVDLWKGSGVEVIHTVDCAEEDWGGCVGVVTSHLEKVDLDFARAAAFVCGPQVMIDVSMRDLSDRGMSSDRILTTLEAHMKCGVGKCGHCYMGASYVCTNGPVFSYKEIQDILRVSEHSSQNNR